MLLLSHEVEVLHNLSRGNAFEVETLATREDGGQHLMHICGCQDEDGVAWWLFQRFEQGIERFCREHVRFVKHIDLVLTRRGRHHHLLAQVSNAVNTAIRGSVNLDYVERVACRNLATLLAFVAWLTIVRIGTIDGFGK